MSHPVNLSALSDSTLQKNKARDITFGIYLGYPECCCLAYVNEPMDVVRTRHDVSFSSGFVPCERCAQIVRGFKGEVNRRKALRSLLRGRKIKQRFPWADCTKQERNEAEGTEYFKKTLRRILRQMNIKPPMTEKQQAQMQRKALEKSLIPPPAPPTRKQLPRNRLLPGE